MADGKGLYITQGTVGELERVATLFTYRDRSAFLDALGAVVFPQIQRRIGLLELAETVYELKRQGCPQTLLPVSLDVLSRTNAHAVIRENKEEGAEKESVPTSVKFSLSDIAWNELLRVAHLAGYKSRADFLTDFARCVTPLFTDLSSMKDLAQWARAADEKPSHIPFQSRFMKEVELEPRKEPFTN